jgi:hypothetical protein
MLLTSLRWVYQHMIEEYAPHNGHADLIRGHIDGAVGTDTKPGRKPVVPATCPIGCAAAATRGQSR